MIDRTWAGEGVMAVYSISRHVGLWCPYSTNCILRSPPRDGWGRIWGWDKVIRAFYSIRRTVGGKYVTRVWRVLGIFWGMLEGGRFAFTWGFSVGFLRSFGWIRIWLWFCLWVSRSWNIPRSIERPIWCTCGEENKHALGLCVTYRRCEEVWKSE